MNKLSISYKKMPWWKEYNPCNWVPSHATLFMTPRLSPRGAFAGNALLVSFRGQKEFIMLFPWQPMTCFILAEKWSVRDGDLILRSNGIQCTFPITTNDVLYIGSSIKSCPIKLKTKCKKKWRWSRRLMKTWHTYNNNIVNLFAKKLIQNLHS